MEANFTKASLIDTNLANSDLRRITGARFDSTIVKGARFSPRANDSWSVLRRYYTGPKFLFHLLFLVAFVLTYGAKTMFYVGVNQAQSSLKQVELKVNNQIDSSVNRIEDVLKQLEQEQHVGIIQMTQDLEQVKEKIHLKISECLPPKCTKPMAVWKALVRWNEGPWYWGTAMALLAYNFFRGLLTWLIAPLRDEEERSGHTPPLYYRPTGSESGWKYFGGLLRSLGEVYGWLIWPHRLVQVFFYLAVGSLLWHGWDLLFNTQVTLLV